MSNRPNKARAFLSLILTALLLTASACGKDPADSSDTSFTSDIYSSDSSFVSSDSDDVSNPSGNSDSTDSSVGSNGGSSGSSASGNNGSSSSGSNTSSGTPIDNVSTSDDPVTSTFFSSVTIEDRNSYTVPGSNGDLWPSAWSNDDYVYTANGDGPGFGSVNSDIAVGRLSGTPGSMKGQGLAYGDSVAKVWSGSEFNRKPTGMVSVGGTLYLAVQDLRSTKDGTFDEAPAASIYKSTDKGKTWTGTSSPMFKDYKFTTIMFLDYGKDNSKSPDGYVYAYGLDNNWRDSFSGLVDDPVNLYLARVPANSVQDITKWEFFSGTSSKPAWSKNIDSRKPVLTDTRRVYERVTDNMPSVRDMSVISQGSIVYNSALKRYIYASWTEYTYEFYESPTPYGPFKLFVQKDFGGYPWSSNTKYGGYGCVIPSKFISSDGRTMWIVSTTFVSDTNQYAYAMRKMTVVPSTTQKANNKKGSTNLARDNSLSPAVISTSNGSGRPQRLNDGAFDFFEQSWTGEAKNLDYWGYSFSKICKFNTIEYTTGEMKNDGGWFSSLGVQVRKNGVWTNVKNGRVSPKYPKTMATGQYKKYTITFDEIEGDAIRIVGKPGGSMRYTTVAELAVYYR